MNTRVRLISILAVALVSIYLGAFAFSDAYVVSLFSKAGYYTIGVTVALFVWFILRAFPFNWDLVKGFVRRREILIGILVSLFGTLFLLRAEPLHFKTIMDEHVIAVTAKRMHESRKVEATTRAQTINNAIVHLKGYVDKRPTLYPFLVSVVNDLTGFRPKNSIYLNVFLTPCMLFLLYAAVLRFSNEITAVCSVALMCSLPVLSFMCAGGGLEPINLLFIILTCFLGGFYLEKPDANRMGAFCLSGILLAQCRYESVLFISVVGLLIFWSWMQQRKLSIQWPLFLCPVLLIPYLWQNRVFRVNEYMWQMRDVEGEKPFSLDYVYDNFGRSVGFFFDLGHEVPNSWFLVLAGLLTSLLLLVSGYKKLHSFRTFHPALQSALFFILGFVALYFLLLAYSWHFDSKVTRRLSLPLHLPLAVAAPYFVFMAVNRRWFGKSFCAILAVYFVVYVFPVTSKRLYGQRSIVLAEFLAAEEFLENHPKDKLIMISENSAYFYLYGSNSLSASLANHRKEPIKFYLNQPLSQTIYYFERLNYDPVEQEFLNSANTWLDEDFVKETYWERPITHLRTVRISKIVDVKGIDLEDVEYDSLGKYHLKWAENLP